MVVPRRRATRTLFALAGAVALLGGGAISPFIAPLIAPRIAPVRAADSPPDPLGGPFVDVALVKSPGAVASPDSPPLMLVVRAPDPASPRLIRLELLGLDVAGWRALASRTVATGLEEPGPAVLVPLDERFALIASDEATGRTFIALIEPDPTGIQQVMSRLEVVGRAAVGAADVDGDGSDELVLAGEAVADGSGGCTGSSLVVLNGETLARRLIAQVDDIGLDGGSIGRFALGGGDDLVAYSHDACEPGVPPTPSGAEFVDLATGHLRHLYGPDGTRFGSSGGSLLPLLADLDGDGIDEPILRSGDSLVVLDPAQAWKAETITTNAIPLAVVDRADRPRLAIEEPAVGATPTSFGLLALGRVGRGGEVIERGLTGVPFTAADPRRPPIAGNELATDPSAPAPAWIGDPSGTGCLVVLVPAATFRRCPDDPSAWSARLGPAWLETVPLVSFGDRSDRRLLVAAGLGWSTARPALAVPGPAATYVSRTGRWRTGPSAPFALAVVDPAPLGDAGALAEPAISVDPNVVDANQPHMFVHGQAGDRIFASIGPPIDLEPGSSEPLPGSGVEPSPVDPGEFLMSGSTDSNGSVVFIPVPAQSVAGARPGAASFPMVATGQLAPAPVPKPAWTVSVLGLNAFGEPSPVLAGRVDLDVTGPGLAVERPFLSLPWPLSVPLRGWTEPGARVRLAGGAFVEAAPDGSFALDVELPPWPQDLTIEAVDGADNRSTEKVSVVGGLDYRQLPWQALVIVAVLLGAGITSFGMPKIRRRSGWLASAPVGQPIQSGLPDVSGPDADGEPEIEDLPTRGSAPPG